MATLKQKMVLQKIVENSGNVSKSMREVGYSSKTAKNPKNLLKSKGFQKLCNEYGLTDDFLIKALVNDIRKKPGKRKAELELAFKIKQRLKGSDAENFNQVNVENVFTHKQIISIAKRFIASEPTANDTNTIWEIRNALVPLDSL